MFIMYMYMLQIQVHEYFSDFGKSEIFTDAKVEDVGVEVHLHTPGTVLLYNTLFSLYWN